jgi:hypothetical protein
MVRRRQCLTSISAAAGHTSAVGTLTAGGAVTTTSPSSSPVAVPPAPLAAAVGPEWAAARATSAKSARDRRTPLPGSGAPGTAPAGTNAAGKGGEKRSAASRGQKNSIVWHRQPGHLRGEGGGGGGGGCLAGGAPPPPPPPLPSGSGAPTVRDKVGPTGHQPPLRRRPGEAGLRGQECGGQVVAVGEVGKRVPTKGGADEAQLGHGQQLGDVVLPWHRGVGGRRGG